VEHDYVVLFIDLVLIKPQVCSTLWSGSRKRRLSRRRIGLMGAGLSTPTA